MKREAYLHRIGYQGSLAPTVETLRQLHRAHMLAVPFENLDVILGDSISLSLPAIYNKIVKRRRGGFCYELNSLFGWLLEELGFAVTRLSARVFDDGRSGAEFDHLALLIELEEPWLADVGFGDSFLDPLRLDAAKAMDQQGSAYRLIDSNADKILQRWRESGWESLYNLSLSARQLADFGDRCRYQQTSPQSHFTQKAICSIATVDGRITLSNHRLIVTTNGQRQVREITSEVEYRSLLKSCFGIALEPGAKIGTLMVPRPRSISD